MEKLKRGNGNCPYSREINAANGRWYCTARESEIGSATFNKYCYHCSDYTGCSTWKRENGYD